MAFKHLLILLLIAVLYAACSSSRVSRPVEFQRAEKIYDSTATEIAKDIRRLPVTDSVMADSFKMPPYEIVTTNFSMRRPNMVIIHHTAQDSCGQTLYTFTQTRTGVSAHYVICKDGTLHHMLNDYLRAWHAGVGKWGTNTDINSSSIGIELDNNGRDSFSLAQINTLLGLLDTLKHKYNIPFANYLGHSDIAPTRKTDPSVYFPWKVLAERGFGLWPGDTSNIVVPQNFDVPMALKIIGYDVANLDAAIAAFRRHFLTRDYGGPLDKQEQKVLYDLMLQSMN